MSYGGLHTVHNLVLPLALAISIIISAAALFFFLCRKKPLEGDEKEPVLPLAKHSASPCPLTEIDAATDGFNHRRIIGKGRLGTVYAGVTPKGELVAVKRIHPRLVLNNAGFGFCSTLKWLSLADHPHLVPIIGFSEAPGERIIEMEFGGMLSLDFYLHQNPDGAALLDWSRRVKIAAGAARGLEYLHEGVAPPIIHGCVKPSNILIDVKFRARVCDYGLHFMGGGNEEEGYVDEEYWREKKGVSKECDVYGFGVVLMELLSGRRSEGGRMVEWGLPLIKEMRMNEFLDARLPIPCHIHPLVRLSRLALACVGNCRSNRPSIHHVAAILTSVEMTLICRIDSLTASTVR